MAPTIELHAMVFAYPVADLESCGIIEYDKNTLPTRLKTLENWLRKPRRSLETMQS